MFKTALALVAGSIILVGAIRRVQTINSQEFISTVRITVFLFTAFAIGLFVVDADATLALAARFVSIPSGSDKGTISWLTLFSFALLPAVLKIVNGEQFSEAWDYLPFFWLSPLIVFIVTVVAYNLDDSRVAIHVVQILWFVGAAVILAFAHSVFGPVLAAFNISLIVASLLGAGVFSVSLVDVFEWLGYLGIYSEALKWVLLAGSTVLGLHGTVGLQSIKDLMP